MESLSFGRFCRLNVLIQSFLYFCSFTIFFILSCECPPSPVLRIPLCPFFTFQVVSSHSLRSKWGNWRGYTWCWMLYLIKILFNQRRFDDQNKIWSYCLRIPCNALYIAKGNAKRSLVLNDENLRRSVPCLYVSRGETVTWKRCISYKVSEKKSTLVKILLPSDLLLITKEL